MSESVEMEHFIGFNSISNGAIFHPNGQKYLFSNGGNLVIGDLIDSHAQEFLRNHDDFITCVALSPSGRLIASGQRGENSDIFVWDYQTRKAIYKFEEHDTMVQGLAFSDDEKILASIGGPEDGNLILWDMSNGCIISSASKLPLGTTCVSFGGFVKDIKRRDTDHYLLCTAGSDGLVLWDLDPYNGDLVPLKLTGEARATINRQITAIHFSVDREYLYGATTSGDYVIASLRSHKIVSAVSATKMSVNSILGLEQGTVVIGCGDCTVKVYSHNGEFRGQVKLDGSVIGLSASPDKSEVLASTTFGSIARVNLKNLTYILISESHTQAVLKVAFDDGTNTRFATASADGTIKIWDLVEYVVNATARCRKEQDRGVIPLSLAFANIVLSGWSDGRVLAHSAETGENLWFVDNAHQGGVTALVLSHNHRFILTGGPAGEVRLWELRTRELISHLKEHKQKITCLALFDDDTSVLTGSRDRCILRWDLKTEIRTHCHMQRMGGINAIVISKDQNYVISVGQDKRIVVWDVRQNDSIFQTFLDEENDEGLAIAISHDGRYIATGGTAGIIRLWSLQLPYSVRFISECVGHSKSINCLEFSGDDKQIVSVGEDGGIFVWCVYTQ